MIKIIFSTIISLLFSLVVFGQNQTFSDSNVEFTFEIPDATWKMVVKPTVGNPNVEFAYGDRMDGHFDIRKIAVTETDLISDLIQREQEQNLQFKPGYVAGKEENFAGNYRGRVFNYEFTKSGKNMSGRYYYLKANDSTVYVIRFTGLRDSLRLIRNQTDSIARTLSLKK